MVAVVESCRGSSRVALSSHACYIIATVLPAIRRTRTLFLSPPPLLLSLSLSPSLLLSLSLSLSSAFSLSLFVESTRLCLA
ncbi:hypothetical protein LX32DRAFT_112848 [Colletotrichum zoysiae]|uniref:Uncharacterized protein n=1 Tax=Colletotrichum zoysiae TaxID=1216348 RepID=A0AAD9LZY4_9PEZI|nr:hypothetical protein LX32DRAFT_112848 [Colletotrichum zoysiae]